MVANNKLKLLESHNQKITLYSMFGLENVRKNLADLMNFDMLILAKLFKLSDFFESYRNLSDDSFTNEKFLISKFIKIQYL